MENGRASFSAEDLYKLAKMLSVAPAWLLTGEGEMEAGEGGKKKE